MRNKKIRFSSNKLNRLFYKLKRIKDSLNKGVIFDIHTPRKARYLEMDKQLCYHHPKYQNNHHKIPFILYKTGEVSKENLPDQIKELFIKIKKENIGIEIKYFGDSDRVHFIKSHFNDDVLRAYLNLKPGAYRADLFRYCILYVNGGIYGDLTQSYLVPLKEIVDFNKDSLVLVRDYLNDAQTTNGIFNAFIASHKGNKTIKTAIDKIVENVQLKNYGISSLDITGPYLLRRALQESNENYRLSLELNPFNNKAIRNIRTGKNVILTKLPNHDELIGKNKSNDYHELWMNKDVFI